MISMPVKKVKKGIDRSTLRRAERLLNDAASRMPDDSELDAAARQVVDFQNSPPWYRRFMPVLLWNRFKLMGEMVVAYKRGEYRNVPPSLIASMVFAILYVVCPVDLIPDYLPVIGFVDDAAVVSLLFGQIQSELLCFVQHQGLDPKDYVLG